MASLEELTMRGCYFSNDDGLRILQSPYRGQTPLKVLSLHRSYIHNEALHNFLSAPRALTHLTLNHDSGLSDMEDIVETPISTDAQVYEIAFRQQIHSLELLRLNEDMCDEIKTGALDLRGFGELLTI